MRGKRLVRLGDLRGMDLQGAGLPCYFLSVRARYFSRLLRQKVNAVVFKQFRVAAQQRFSVATALYSASRYEAERGRKTFIRRRRY